MKKKQKWLPWVLFLLAVISFFASCYFIYRVCLPGLQLYQIVFGSIISGLLFLLVVLIGWYLYLSRDVEPNFFLFDRKRRANISVENLTFSCVNERMTFLMCQIAETQQKMWQGEVLLHEDELFGYRSVYKPLVAYKMVYDLIGKDFTGYEWSLAKHADPTALQAWKEALNRAGEHQFSETFAELLCNLPQEAGRLQEFVQKNAGYLRKKMLAYVQKHIELFY